MIVNTFAVPIKTGKLEAWESWVDELNGPRKVEFESFNERYGLTTHGAWLQTAPDGSHLVIVVTDGPGSPTFMGRLATSQNEFDSWFRSGIEDVHPIDLSAPPPPSPERRL